MCIRDRGKGMLVDREENRFQNRSIGPNPWSEEDKEEESYRHFYALTTKYVLRYTQFCGNNLGRICNSFFGLFLFFISHYFLLIPRGKALTLLPLQFSSSHIPSHWSDSLSITFPQSLPQNLPFKSALQKSGVCASKTKNLKLPMLTGFKNTLFSLVPHKTSSILTFSIQLIIARLPQNHISAVWSLLLSCPLSEFHGSHPDIKTL